MTMVGMPRSTLTVTKNSSDAMAITISGVTMVPYTKVSNAVRSRCPTRCMPIAASVPKVVARTALMAATIKLVFKALRIDGSVQAVPYHLSEKPLQTSTNRDALKEKMMTTTIGRNKKAHTSAV